MTDLDTMIDPGVFEEELEINGDPADYEPTDIAEEIENEYINDYGDWLTEAGREAISCAREWIEAKPVYLDTETTGLGQLAEICDIAVIDHDGTVLLDTLIKPREMIPAAATAVHSITNEMVHDAPNIVDVLPRLENALRDRLVVIYNAAYDVRVIWQSLSAYDIIHADLDSLLEPLNCAMLLFAQFYGDWSPYHCSFTWKKLNFAAQHLGIAIPADLHRARADAELTRQVVHALASKQL